MQLPQFQSPNTVLQLMQSKWASILNPVLDIPLNNRPSVLKDVVLATGNNVINHRLGRKPIGWIVTDVDANVGIYRSAEFNDLTLTLNSSGAATVSLLVF